MTYILQPAAISDAPSWALILMVVIIVMLIALLYKEIWSYLTKMQTGIILLVILSLLSMVGGLLPQHLSKAVAATELLKVELPDVVDGCKAAELMGIVCDEDVEPATAATMLHYPIPGAISEEEAIELMGITPPAGQSVAETYTRWLRAEYAKSLITTYRKWFNEKVSERGQPWATFWAIGFFTIYHTWYYLTLAYLLFLSLLFCTIKRLSAFLTSKKKDLAGQSVDVLMKRPEVHEYDLTSGGGDASDAVIALAKGGYRARVCDKKSDGFQLDLDFGFRVHHTLSSSLFHLAIFIALIGFLMTGFYSWKNHVWIETGQTEEIKYEYPTIRMYEILGNFFEKRGWKWADPSKHFDIESGFGVQCHEYFSEYVTSDDDWYALKDYKSDLSVMVDGKEVQRRIIEVNFPIIYKGVYLYQTNVRESGVLVVTAPNGKQYQSQAAIWGTDLPQAPGLNPMLYASPLVRGQLKNEDGTDTAIGPMIRVGLVKAADKSMWPDPGEQKAGMGGGGGMPDFDWSEVGIVREGEKTMYNGYTFELTGPWDEATGLEVRKDPGVRILWISFIILISMMILRAYIPTYSARLDVTPNNKGGVKVVIAGRIYGLNANFKKHADKMSKLLG